MRRWALRLALLLVGLWAVHAIFLRLTRIAPPADAWQRAQAMPKPIPQAHGTRTVIGDNWVGRERGIWEYHLRGDALSMGYAHARLGTPLIVRTDEYMFDEMHRYVPSQAALFLIRMGVLLRYRHLLDAVNPDLRVEMTGMSVGQPDFHADFLPLFHRIVFYHALHDITQTLEHSPLLGCTAFAAMGEATARADPATAGHLIIGRNFDFEGPPIFDSDKAVLFFQPSEPGKLAFASVAWAGMLGVVTGLNAAGIYVSVNALRTDDKGQSGVPVELLLREVMEGAHSLDEAIAIIGRRPVFVPDLYVLGDGDRREAAVIERSPTRSIVRRSRDVLAVANHALSPEYQDDAENARLRSELTSGARQARTEQLLLRNRGRIDPALALAMLRDKRGVGDKELGLGNRNALDALIATHSVVVDATSRVLWVGQGPHALGRYVAFDLRRELLAGPRTPPPGPDYPADLPEDPTRHSAEYRQFLESEQALQSAELLARHRELDRAIDQAERAVALSPLHCDARKRLADLYYQRNRADDREIARRHYQIFLTLSPPYLRDVREAEARLLPQPAR